MTSLLELQDRLLHLNATIAQTQQAIASHPDDVGLNMSVASLVRRREGLEQQLLRAANDAGKDVCRYRLFDVHDAAPKASPVATALVDFQELVAQFYASLKANVPRNRSTMSGEVRAATSFGLAYTFPGSLGFVLTLSNAQMESLFEDKPESTLDKAVKAALGAARSTRNEEISEIAHSLGTAPVKALYDWAQHLSFGGLGVDVEWRRGDISKAELLIQLPEVIQLKTVIDEIGGEVEEEFEIIGELVSVNHKGKGHFTLAISEKEFIAGQLSEEVKLRPMTTLGYYNARIKKVTTIQYSVDKPRERYILLSLVPLA